jgi:hypothetical protein
MRARILAEIQPFFKEYFGWRNRFGAPGNARRSIQNQIRRSPRLFFSINLRP